MNDLISVATCEDFVNGNQGLLLKPNNNESLELFSVSDPFGIRKAIVPVLLMDENQIMNGMGTAFHVDGFGTFLTASHVVHSGKPDLFNPKKESRTSTEFTPVLILGVGVVFGTVGLPPNAEAIVQEVGSPVYDREDPLALLRGEISYEAIDLAILKTRNSISKEMNMTLPLRISSQPPQINDLVVAIGYPELSCKQVSLEYQRYLLSDGMKAAYGKIINIHPEGRGNKTPVFEVEANWPSGMSGGPVFNKNGEVIGIVSRSLTPSENFDGNGTALSFACLPQISEWLPSVDPYNPGWRKGWMISESADLVFNPKYFFRTREEACAAALQLGVEYDVLNCIHKIGSENFVIL